jgi:hypothetical protein
MLSEARALSHKSKIACLGCGSKFSPPNLSSHLATLPYRNQLTHNTTMNRLGLRTFSPRLFTASPVAALANATQVRGMARKSKAQQGDARVRPYPVANLHTRSGEADGIAI